MRWTWVIPRLILVATVWSAVYFGLDPLLRQSAVGTAQSITGARADMAALSTSLFPPALTMQGVALASSESPGSNILEFDRMECRLGGHALLRRSFVIEDARLTGLRFGTARNDNGQLKVVPATEPEPPSWLAEKLKDTGDAWLTWLNTR